jgi:hypothetical protein
VNSNSTKFNSQIFKGRFPGEEPQVDSQAKNINNSKKTNTKNIPTLKIKYLDKENEIKQTSCPKSTLVAFNVSNIKITTTETIEKTNKKSNKTSKNSHSITEELKVNYADIFPEDWSNQTIASAIKLEESIKIKSDEEWINIYCGDDAKHEQWKTNLSSLIGEIQDRFRETAIYFDTTGNSEKHNLISSSITRDAVIFNAISELDSETLSLVFLYLGENLDEAMTPDQFLEYIDQNSNFTQDDLFTHISNFIYEEESQLTQGKKNFDPSAPRKEHNNGKFATPATKQAAHREFKDIFQKDFPDVEKKTIHHKISQMRLRELAPKLAGTQYEKKIKDRLLPEQDHSQKLVNVLLNWWANLEVGPNLSYLTKVGDAGSGFDGNYDPTTGKATPRTALLKEMDDGIDKNLSTKDFYDLFMKIQDSHENIVREANRKDLVGPAPSKGKDVWYRVNDDGTQNENGKKFSRGKPKEEKKSSSATVETAPISKPNKANIAQSQNPKPPQKNTQNKASSNNGNNVRNSIPNKTKKHETNTIPINPELSGHFKKYIQKLNESTRIDKQEKNILISTIMSIIENNEITDTQRNLILKHSESLLKFDAGIREKKFAADNNDLLEITKFLRK